MIIKIQEDKISRSLVIYSLGLKVNRLVTERELNEMFLSSNVQLALVIKGICSMCFWS